MPWGRVDDHHYRHEKVAELHEDHRKGAIALFWLAISWCNDRLTDGRVPRGTVRILGGEIAEADELVRVGLWEPDGSGYRIHDFLDFNKSKAQVEQERVQRSLAGQAGAHARWHPDSESPNEPVSEVPNDAANEVNGGKDAPVTRIPSPVTPSPAPDARDGEDEEAAVLSWLAAHGCYVRPGNGFHRSIVTSVAQHGGPALLVALDRVSAAGAKNGDTKGLLFGAIDLLNEQSRPDIRALARSDQSTKRRSRAVEQTKVRAHETGFHAEERDPMCPRCMEGAA